MDKKDKRESVEGVHEFQNAEELIADGDSILKVSILMRNGTVKECEVSSTGGIVIIGEDTNNGVLSLAQGNSGYLAYSLNMLLALMLKALLNDVPVRALYEMTRPMTEKVLENLVLQAKLFMLAQFSTTIKKGEGN